jgi:uncharacterized membrane protein
MEWPEFFRVTAIIFAACGGTVSVAAFVWGRRTRNNKTSARTPHIMYLISYILMSLSIFFISIIGLLA